MWRPRSILFVTCDCKTSFTCSGWKAGGPKDLISHQNITQINYRSPSLTQKNRPSAGTLEKSWGLWLYSPDKSHVGILFVLKLVQTPICQPIAVGSNNILHIPNLTPKSSLPKSLESDNQSLEGTGFILAPTLRHPPHMTSDGSAGVDTEHSLLKLIDNTLKALNHSKPELNAALTCHWWRKETVCHPQRRMPCLCGPLGAD